MADIPNPFICHGSRVRVITGQLEGEEGTVEWIGVFHRAHTGPSHALIQVLMSDGGTIGFSEQHLDLA